MSHSRKSKELLQDAYNTKDAKEISQIMDGIRGFSTPAQQLDFLLDKFAEKESNSKRRLRPMPRFYSTVIKLLKDQAAWDEKQDKLYQNAIEAIQAVIQSPDLSPAAKNHTVVDIARVSLTASGNQLTDIVCIKQGITAEKQNVQAINKLEAHIPRISALAFSAKTLAADAVNTASRLINSLSNTFGLFSHHKALANKLSTPARALASFCSVARQNSIVDSKKEHVTKDDISRVGTDYFQNESLENANYSPL